MNDDMTCIMKTFFAEGRDLLDTMENCLLNLERDAGDRESVNALFRAVHTIKGSSGMFDFTEMVKFTHQVENILDLVRRDIVLIDETLIDILLESRDYINSLFDEYELDSNAVINTAYIQTGSQLVESLNRYIDADRLTAGEDGSTDENPGDVEDTSCIHVSSIYWHLSLRFKKDLFRNGFDPQSFICYLGEIGEIVSLAAVDDGIPSLDVIDPESCYLGFEIALEGALSKQSIAEAFEFVRDDCEIRILPPRSSMDEYIKLINELPETPMRIGEILNRIGTLTESELQYAVALQNKLSGDNMDQPADQSPLIGQILVDNQMVYPPVLNAAIEKQRENNRAEERKSRSIRIDAEKLDDIINVIGELVITGAGIYQISEKTEDMELNLAVSTLLRLVEDVRDKIMNTRMVQIGDTFKRFERVVRDFSRETGKDVELTIMGGETELDKTLIEKISDPLMHLIRNSLDHGIDTPDERISRGKPGCGSISLNAYHETGSIVIEVKDDGKGLDSVQIRRKGVESGLIRHDQIVDENELFQLIFEPGFSTAERVTNISGRGVGMDVVKKNIEALRGSIFLESSEQSGMTVRIHLPLTLAIIDGFMAEACGSYYVIPLDMIREVVEVQRSELVSRECSNIINLRGEVLPFMRLRDFFGVPEGNDNSTEYVIVVEYARKKAGLVVDQLIGEFQTVIKSLGQLFRELEWVSGATILGTGEVALILDVPRLIGHSQMAESAHSAVL